MKHVAVTTLLVATLLGYGCASEDGGGGTTWTWDLPSNFPEPSVPDDNPMNAAKVELGRRLFYDQRLSENGEGSCASCHAQEHAFTDALAHAVGSTGQTHPRSSMALGNTLYEKSYLWANPTVTTLEEQALLPIIAEDPIVELGFAGKEGELVERLRDIPDYVERFRKAFPSEAEPLVIANVTRAIAAFERTLISANSPYDRFVRNEDPAAMSESAQRGMDLFFSEKVECFHCHGSFNFSASVNHQSQVLEESKFENNGLYNVDGAGAYPAENQGLYALTEDPSDQGKFKPPTLRNIELTAPYMHDGSIATLEEVIDHYAAGGRFIMSGENAGDGRANPNKNPFISGFELTEQERGDLLAFLRSLTDTDFVTNPEFADPFAAP
ncbi:MAG: di-heme enzyme [Polyangiales bacterium]